MNKSVLFVSEDNVFLEKCKKLSSGLGITPKLAGSGRSGLAAYSKENAITIVIYLHNEQTELFVNFFRSQYGGNCPLIVVTDVSNESFASKDGILYLNSDFKSYELESFLRHILSNCNTEKFTIKKLKEFDKTRADLIHSINQPLTSVIGYIDMMRMYEDEHELPDEVSDMLKKLEEGSKSLYDYIDKLRNHRLFPKE